MPEPSCIGSANAVIARLRTKTAQRRRARSTTSPRPCLAASSYGRAPIHTILAGRAHGSRRSDSGQREPTSALSGVGRRCRSRLRRCERVGSAGCSRASRIRGETRPVCPARSASLRSLTSRNTDSLCPIRSLDLTARPHSLDDRAQTAVDYGAISGSRSRSLTMSSNRSTAREPAITRSRSAVPPHRSLRSSTSRSPVESINVKPLRSSTIISASVCSTASNARSSDSTVAMSSSRAARHHECCRDARSRWRAPRRSRRRFHPTPGGQS